MYTLMYMVWEKRVGGVFYIGGVFQKKFQKKIGEKNKLGYKFVLIKFGD